MDIYLPLPYYEELSIQPGERVRLVGAPDDWEGSIPSPIGEVFEEDEQFVFARASSPRFKRHLISEKFIIARGRRSDVALRGLPDTYITIERKRKALKLEVCRQLGNVIVFATKKETGEDFSEELVLQGPDDYFYLAGSHKIEPGEAARIVCGTMGFHDVEKFPKSGEFSWHAGDLISGDDTWTFHNPRGETEETSKVVLKVGDRVMIGREFVEGWQQKGFRVTLSNSEGSVTETIGPRFYGSAIPPELDYHSRLHAVIEVQEGGAQITDFSSSGTLVCIKRNTEPFHEVVRLKYIDTTKPEEKRRGFRSSRAVSIGDGKKYTQDDHPLMRGAERDINAYLWALTNANEE